MKPRSTLSYSKFWSCSSCVICFILRNTSVCRSQWQRGLRCWIASVRLLGFRVRILPGAWMYASVERCVLSGRGFGLGQITRPEEPYGM